MKTSKSVNLPHLRLSKKVAGIARYQLHKNMTIISNWNKAQNLFIKPRLTSLRLLLHNKHFSVTYKDGRKFSTHDIWKLYDLRSREYAEFKWNNILIKHAERGECEEVFSGEYDWLPVSGRIVLDIGANIGDSAIYFALHGAKHVYGIEVNPSVYKIAKENIKSNKLESKITILNCGIGKGRILIDPSNTGAGEFQPKNNKNGISIPLYSLENVLSKLHNSFKNTNNLVMKIDCEGCEYNALLNADDKTLKKFSAIIGEYHYDYPLLKERLDTAGFKTKFNEPTYFFDPLKNTKECLVGLFKAWRDD